MRFIRVRPCAGRNGNCTYADFFDYRAMLVLDALSQRVFRVFRRRRKIRIAGISAMQDSPAMIDERNDVELRLAILFRLHMEDFASNGHIRIESRAHLQDNPSLFTACGAKSDHKKFFWCSLT